MVLFEALNEGINMVISFLLIAIPSLMAGGIALHALVKRITINSHQRAYLLVVWGLVIISFLLAVKISTFEYESRVAADVLLFLDLICFHIFIHRRLNESSSVMRGLNWVLFATAVFAWVLIKLVAFGVADSHMAIKGFYITYFAFGVCAGALYISGSSFCLLRCVSGHKMK